ncbi:MAG: hypothetical protein ABSH06_18985 [Thermodesulfobacteriota bacterium]|jgi:hypothetical protein
MSKFNFKSFKERWASPIVAREEIRNFTGGAINEKYMANLDSQKQGPDERFHMGRKVVYPVDSLIRWLEKRSEGNEDDE